MYCMTYLAKNEAAAEGLEELELLTLAGLRLHGDVVADVAVRNCP